MEQTGFAVYNPIVCFAYFIGAFLLGVITMHPVCQLLQLLFAVSAYVIIKGSCTIKKTIAFIFSFAALSVANPIFNTRGNTVIFSYLWGRQFTLEALLLGITLAAMFVSMLLWFSVLSFIMTDDKLMYVFGKASPNIGMVLAMTLKFVPNYFNHIKEIKNARRSMGKASGEDGKKKEWARVMTAVTAWSLENGVITSESMKNRGYGSGKRSVFGLYSMKKKDIIVLVLLTGLLAVTIFCKAKGGFGAQYFPQIKINGTEDFHFVLGICTCTLYYMFPILINIRA